MKGGVRPNLSSSSINRSPVRHSTGGSVNSSLCGDRDRRELHLASHNLSTDAGRQNVVLNVEKQNKSLSSHVRESDEQLDRTKAELRKARATIQQYERQEENLQRRLEQAHADKVAAQALGEEAADRARKLDAKLAVGLHQRGMGAVQREAKAAEALLLLKERDAELAAARREAMLLRLSVSLLHSVSPFSVSPSFTFSALSFTLSDLITPGTLKLLGQGRKHDLNFTDLHGTSRELSILPDQLLRTSTRWLK